MGAHGGVGSLYNFMPIKKLKMKMFLYVYAFHVVMYQVLKGLKFFEDFPLLFCLFKLHV
jgi:hypothetical protein